MTVMRYRDRTMLLKERLMSLTDLAAIASVISSAAVAITLIFLALQVRQAEKNQRAMMQQGRADRVSAQALQVASNPQFSVLFNKGMQRPEELTREELDQFILLLRGLFLSGEDSFLQHQAGLLDKAAYRSHVAGTRYMLSAWPGLRAGWRLMAGQYSEAFQRFMNDIVGEVPSARARDWMTQWTAILQAEKIVAASPGRAIDADRGAT
jgi:hypothetical protein